MAQTFNLRAGWNAIWLEVTPVNDDINIVFQGLPLESVWTFASVVSSVDFIQNADEPVWNRDRWLVHVPLNRVESLNNNLFKVLGNRAYLVKLTAPATLTVNSEPKLRFPEWAAEVCSRSVHDKQLFEQPHVAFSKNISKGVEAVLVRVVAV